LAPPYFDLIDQHTTTATSVAILPANQPAPSPCTRALVLTQAMSGQSGAVWHDMLQSVDTGFSTMFTFSAVNISQRCVRTLELAWDGSVPTEPSEQHDYFATCSSGGPPDDLELPLSSLFNGVKDLENYFGQAASGRRYGGDDFTLVIQFNASHPFPSPTPLNGLSFAGIANSIAVHFDFFQHANDHYHPHLTVYWIPAASHPSSTHPPTPIPLSADVQLPLPPSPPSSPSSLGWWGEWWARVVMWQGVRWDYMDAGLMTASNHMGKRNLYSSRGIYTLCVFVSATPSTTPPDPAALPLMCLLVDLSTLMTFDEGQATVGFTASTGRTEAATQVNAGWAGMALHSWAFCSTPNDVRCAP